MTDQIWTLDQGDTLHISGPATVTAQTIGNRRSRRATVRVVSPVDVTVTRTTSPTPPDADNKPG